MHETLSCIELYTKEGCGGFCAPEFWLREPRPEHPDPIQPEAASCVSLPPVSYQASELAQLALPP